MKNLLICEPPLYIAVLYEPILQFPKWSPFKRDCWLSSAGSLHDMVGAVEEEREELEEVAGRRTRWKGLEEGAGGRGWKKEQEEVAERRTRGKGLEEGTGESGWKEKQEKMAERRSKRKSLSYLSSLFSL